MTQDSCYLCGKMLPEKQSFYQDHGVKVCLECFKITPRCAKCQFPSHQQKQFPGIGKVCEFCQEALNTETGMECYLCQKIIPSWASFYTDHEKQVCQDCFKDARRCFLCRFPHDAEMVQGLGAVCEFCTKSVLKKGIELEPFITPLKAFLQMYQHQVPDNIRFEWVDWQLLVGMQMKQKKPDHKIRFLDEYLRHCYPIYYLKERFYLIQRIPHPLFMAHIAGQFVYADLCRQYQQPHLNGNTPFALLARGWSHWIAYQTAKKLQYVQVEKQLRRGLDPDLSGDFPKFLAIEEYRSTGEILAFAQNTLRQFAEKYL